MKGFDPKFRDFPDYILGVTHEIWEERRIDSLRRHYAEGIVVRSPAGASVGNRAVIAATLSTLAEFPDRRLLGEDVIWCGTPEEGMLSSHRLFCTATHSGDGAYGEATGRRIAYRVIADCHARNGVIDDEWLIRDQGAIVRQLGLKPREYAAEMIAREGGPENCSPALTPETDPQGPYEGEGNDDEWGMKYADILSAIMQADMDVFAREYDRAVQCEHPGGFTGRGRGEAERFWMGLRASFPSAEFSIHHRIGREDSLMPPRCALRWSLRGKHEGWGIFGAPSGAEIYALGISHAEFGPFGLRRECALIDETAIWKQILMHSGDS